MVHHRSRSPLEWTLTTLILLVAALLRFHDLGNIPKGLEHDEVATWHMVDNVLGGRLVFYFEEGYGHEPLFNYITVLPMSLFGHNWLGERFWAPWFGLFAVAATYALMRRVFNPVVGMAAAGLQATVLWALFFNRLGLRLNLLPFLLCVAAYCFWRGMESVQARLHGACAPDPQPAGAIVERRIPGSGGRLGWFAGAGALMGVCTYTYMSSRVVPIIFGAFALYLVARDRWYCSSLSGDRPGWQEISRHWWPVLVCFVIAALVMLPLALYLLDRPQATDIPQRESQVDMPLRELLKGNLGPVLENMWGLIKMWNVDGERYWQLNYAHRPVFVEPISGVLFWLGALIALWRWKEPGMALLLIWAGLGMVPSLLTSEAPSWPRTMLASPAALALPGIAGAFLVDWLKRFKFRLFLDLGICTVGRYAVLALLALSLLWTGVLTYRDFMVVWPRHPRVRYAFQSSMTEALRYLDAADDASPVAMAGLSPHDMDPWTQRSTLRRRDLDIRWLDVRSALAVPAGDVARMIALDITPIDPALAGWAGLTMDDVIAQGGIVPRGGTEADLDAPVYHDPAYTVYRLDAIALRQRIEDAASPIYAGSDPFDATPLSETPQFGGLVRLIGYEWLSKPQAGQQARLLTFWLTLDTGPGSTVYAEPALRTFVHLLDAEQRVAAGVDVLGVAPDTWRPGDVIVQLHVMDAPDRAGTYAVEVGWYVPPDGPRLSVDGIDAPGQRVLLKRVEIGE